MFSSFTVLGAFLLGGVAYPILLPIGAVMFFGGLAWMTISARNDGREIDRLLCSLSPESVETDTPDPAFLNRIMGLTY